MWQGEDPRKDLIFLARNNLPLQNVWYAKAALDAAVWSHLFEWVNPGYAARTAVEHAGKASSRGQKGFE